MSRSLNKVTRIRNLGKDPEVRTTSNGSKVASFSVATSRVWNDQSGSKQEKTEWHRCVAWNTNFSKLADVVEKYVKKGDKVYVEGRIEYGQYQDKDGQTRYTTDIWKEFFRKLFLEAEPVYAFAVVGRPAPLLEPVPRLVGPAGSASIVGDLIYGGSTVQVRPPKVSKWSGVLAFCAEQGLDPGRILAVGDGANDLELLEGAAVACVVDTAAPAVLARADHLIGPPATGGWAAVLELARRPAGGS